MEWGIKTKLKEKEMSVKEASLQTLRGYLFDEIIKLREGTAVEKESIALSKISHQIINTYNTEILALKTINELKDKNSGLAKSVFAIEFKNEM